MPPAEATQLPRVLDRMERVAAAQQFLAEEARRSKEAEGAPGRVVGSGVSPSGQACLFTRRGKKLVNQDAVLVWEEFAGDKDTVLCAVMDGHGVMGERVSCRVRDSLPLLLLEALKAAQQPPPAPLLPECAGDRTRNKSTEPVLPQPEDPSFRNSSGPGGLPLSPGRAPLSLLAAQVQMPAVTGSSSGSGTTDSSGAPLSSLACSHSGPQELSDDGAKSPSSEPVADSGMSDAATSPAQSLSPCSTSCHEDGEQGSPTLRGKDLSFRQGVGASPSQVPAEELSLRRGLGGSLSSAFNEDLSFRQGLPELGPAPSSPVLAEEFPLSQGLSGPASLGTLQGGGREQAGAEHEHQGEGELEEVKGAAVQGRGGSAGLSGAGSATGLEEMDAACEGALAAQGRTSAEAHILAQVALGAETGSSPGGAEEEELAVNPEDAVLQKASAEVVTGEEVEPGEKAPKRPALLPLEAHHDGPGDAAPPGLARKGAGPEPQSTLEDPEGAPDWEASAGEKCDSIPTEADVTGSDAAESAHCPVSQETTGEAVAGAECAASSLIAQQGSGRGGPWADDGGVLLPGTSALETCHAGHPAPEQLEEVAGAESGRPEGAMVQQGTDREGQGVGDGHNSAHEVKGDGEGGGGEGEGEGARMPSPISKGEALSASETIHSTLGGGPDPAEELEREAPEAGSEEAAAEVASEDSEHSEAEEGPEPWDIRMTFTLAQAQPKRSSPQGQQENPVSATGAGVAREEVIAAVEGDGPCPDEDSEAEPQQKTPLSSENSQPDKVGKAGEGKTGPVQEDAGSEKEKLSPGTGEEEGEGDGEVVSKTSSFRFTYLPGSMAVSMGGLLSRNRRTTGEALGASPLTRPAHKAATEPVPGVEEHGVVSTGKLGPALEVLSRRFSRQPAVGLTRLDWERVFDACNREIRLHPHINPMYSGATAVVALLQGRRLTLAHVGDSRAVLGVREPGRAGLRAVQLSRDHKAGEETERHRVEKAGGRVFADPREPQTMRVWLPRENIPGLAVTRAFGDEVLKPHGVCSAPEVLQVELDETAEVLILASDGVWDKVSNEEAVREADPEGPASCSGPSCGGGPWFGRRDSAAKRITELATQRWGHRCRDDISVVVLRLGGDGEPTPGRNFLCFGK